jgi:hypothetical protein
MLQVREAELRDLWAIFSPFQTTLRCSLACNVLLTYFVIRLAGGLVVGDIERRGGELVRDYRLCNPMMPPATRFTFGIVHFHLFSAMLRFFGTQIPKRASTNVTLHGEFLPCKYPDMPTVIAFPDLLEDPESLLPYFDKTFQENRNLWLLSYRNSWGSDRCDTMSA